MVGRILVGRILTGVLMYLVGRNYSNILETKIKELWNKGQEIKNAQ